MGRDNKTLTQSRQGGQPRCEDQVWQGKKKAMAKTFRPYFSQLHTPDLKERKKRLPPSYWEEPLTWPEEHCWPNLVMYLGMVDFQSLSSVTVFLTFWHCSSVMASLCFWASLEA